MKQKLLFWLSVFGLLCLTSLSFTAENKTQAEEKKNIETKEKKKMILIVYYSRTGNTQKVAEDLAKRLNADQERIIDKKSRKGIWGYVTGARDALKKRLTEIEKPAKDPAAYDLVIIGTPIWGGKMAPAVRTYLTQYKSSCKAFSYFITAGGAEPEKSAQDMEAVAGKKPVSFTGILAKELKPKSKDIYEQKMVQFLATLK